MPAIRLLDTEHQTELAYLHEQLIEGEPVQDKSWRYAEEYLMQLGIYNVILVEENDVRNYKRFLLEDRDCTIRAANSMTSFLRNKKAYWIEQEYGDLLEEIRQCEGIEMPLTGNIKNFLIREGIHHIREIDYSIREKYEQYLMKEKKPEQVLRYLKTLDRIKQYHIRQEMKQFANIKKFYLKYEQQILFLPYLPDQKLAMEFDKVRDKTELVWDFSVKASEKMKQQIFQLLIHILENVKDPKDRRVRFLLPMQWMYQYCINQGIVLLISWREASSMSEHDVLKKNRNFYIGVGGTVLEGLLSGSLFMLLYSVMQFLWSGQFDMNRVLVLTCVIAVVFLLRILIYSYGYTKAQIGGAEVSKNTRLFMGDHLKRIPLSRFTQGQTGDYINTITSDVNNYEKILTHKIGDMAKSFALSLMLIIFVMTIYVPAGIILLIADLLLIPGLWLSFRMVRKYGKEKNDICAENVSSIVEYVSGIQTFRAYGVGGLKNKTVINAMREFCRISFVYEAKVLPIGAGFGILSWLSCPLVIWTAYAPWATGTLDTVSYLLICMLPLFCAKLANSIFVDLTSYKNLMISKNKILGVMNEPEETGSMEPLQTATHEINFDSVDFSYVPGEPVLKHATFTVPDQKLTAIVGDSGSGKSTILNLIAKYYEATGGTISIGGKPINHVAAERVLEQISMVDQDVFLFDDTIRENIRHARPEATDEEIEAACREANCDGFIRKMEKGYDTPTGENGNLLSGGERQRISIARAILKNSPILLLDEATASLDIENELAVKQAIANLLKEKKTVVMIAHTLSIVKNADQILVMGDGRIAESGTHEELLAKGGKYAAMWNAEQKISA